MLSRAVAGRYAAVNPVEVMPEIAAIPLRLSSIPAERVQNGPCETR